MAAKRTHPTKGIETIGVACDQVVELISEFLDFFKCEAGYLMLKETEFEVKALMEECVAVVQALVASHGLTLRVTIDQADRQIVADRQRIRQILLNLLINAVKFTPHGGRISLGSSDANDGFEFSVADTGIGMTATDIAKALTPFGQINSGFADDIAGTGLGLSFAKRLVELHGGCLEIESEPNRGSQVIVRLPAKKHHPETDQEDGLHEKIA